MARYKCVYCAKQEKSQVFKSLESLKGHYETWHYEQIKRDQKTLEDGNGN